MRVNCPYCNSNKVIKRGQHPKQRYQCTDRKHPEGVRRYFYGEKSVAEVWLVDIETLPGIKRFWRLGEEDWSPETIVHDWIVCAYSAKRLFDSKVLGGVLTPKEALARDDKRIVGEMWRVFNNADILIAHNGDNFDIPRMNVRYLKHGLGVPAPYLTIDTKKAASRYFNFTSNRLAALAEFLGLQPKLHTDYQLWVGCEKGDKESLRYMLEYNQGDISTLEDVYVELRPWIGNHPNMSLYMDLAKDEYACKYCGSDNLTFDGAYRTTASTFEAFQCGDCGGWGRRATKLYTTSVR
jgi:hypothetical protein